MTRRKSSPGRGEPGVEGKDDFAVGRPLNRKQVQDMIRRKETLAEADLRGCDLSGVSFDGADLRFAKFAEANLTRCSFRNANLEGASFFGASLKDATLEDCNLEDADLDFAWLDGVSLRGSKVRKAIFPLKKVPLEEIRESVKNGKRLRMDPIAVDDED
ncbi:MAG TPA: pentapeptide repeat-containing protein [Myxococcota bacterium]|nr:pentapeptide repeat-containing protein [Myxococcota bacterium]